MTSTERDTTSGQVTSVDVTPPAPRTATLTNGKTITFANGAIVQ